MGMKPGKCRLCKRDRDLAHSHVLSEFLYQDTYGDLHTFVYVPTDLRQKPKKFQKGLREYLLCLECEARLNPWETYSSKLLGTADTYTAKNKKEILIPNFNYPFFKLFGLSLLWRSHVTTDDFFKQVNLGPHAEKIRLMLLSQTPGTPFEYPFSLLKIEGPPITGRTIQSPVTARFHGHRTYLLLAYGFEWTFIVSSHSDNLTDEYPFVGVLPELKMFIQRKTQDQFLHEVGSKMYR